MFDMFKIMAKVDDLLTLLMAISRGIDAIKTSNDEIKAATKEVLASNAALLDIEKNKVA